MRTGAHNSPRPARPAPALLRALDGERPDRTPVWFMRQAGRSLPEYRALRRREGAPMLDLCLRPRRRRAGRAGRPTPMPAPVPPPPSGFAVMGAVYAEKMLGVSNPRIGLLSNGEEESKGNELARETFKLLAASAHLNFYGNIEPKEVFTHKVDVVVTDGFSGNIFMKTTESTARMVTEILKAGFLSNPLTKLGALLNKSTLRTLKKKVDPERIGAAPLLGVDGLAYVGHGRSNTNATIGGLRRVKEAADGKLIDEIRRRIPLELSRESGE